MTIRGLVKDGVVVPEAEGQLQEGAEVMISSPDLSSGTVQTSLAEAMQDFIGIGNDMPADGSRNLDHYLYGAPKK